jgi:DNA mismatch endonuclease Vsr
MPSPPKTHQLPRPDFADVPDVRRRNLSAVRGRDTKPELVVRKLLHTMGYHYRLQRQDLPGRPDIVLPGRKAVIDVRGCFWHRHPDPACRNAVLPRTRADWWAAKLARNVERDQSSQATLEAAGWRVMVVWECEVRRDQGELTNRLAAFLGPAGGRMGATRVGDPHS